ncbi:Vgb family protein [Streptomyces harbinensis]|uniref:Vgb family protein n=1 Tax=Streptomyces harbinensis TaxID=1176198 RepID=UPI0036A1FF1B
MTSGTPGLPAPGLPAPDLLAPGLDGTAPYGITAGPDGALWWVEIAAGRVGRITTGGEISGFPLPDPAARPHVIAADPTGDGCWFTEWGAGSIGHVAPDGTFRHARLPAPGAEPHGLAVTADGTVWAALESGRPARLRPA